MDARATIARILRSLRAIRPYLSLRPFDTATAEGRARERQRRALLSSLVAMAAKVISVGTTLITIPLTLNYLGAERFGMWMTMSSVIAMLTFADLGIGNGLLNVIAEANGRDDSAAMRRSISSAAIVLTFIAALVFAAFSLVYTSVSWANFFNVHTPVAIAEAGPAAYVLVGCFALNIPATMIQRIQLGLQMGFVASLWQAAGSVMALLAVLVVVHVHAGLEWLVLAFAGTPVIAAAVNGGVFFSFRPYLLPRLSLANQADASKVMHIGFLFFVLQVAVAMAFLSDNVIIARILGASAVSTYAVPDKMFSVIPLLFSMMMTPLWPAYGEAIARGDGFWVRQILRKSVIASFLISVPLSLCLIVLGPRLLSAWLGYAVAPPLALLLGMGLWKVLEALGNSLGAFLNGANVVRMQVIVSSAMALCAVTLKFILVRSLGVSGAVWATILAYSLLVLLPYSLWMPKILSGVLNKRTGS
jgi:O-antigen/teichoic acid export membrane protein